MKYNANLDAMRALAAFAVVAHHYQILQCGWIGVQFFFVLSGFLISSMVLQAKAAKGNTYDFFQRFYTRRMLRLFPVYFGYVGILGVLYLVFGKPQAFGQVWPALFTYMINFQWLDRNYVFHPYYGHLWSLAVEWQFYLIWPFLLWSIPSKNLLRTLLWFIPLAMLLRIAGYAIYSHVESSIAFGGSAEDKALPAYVLPFSHLDAFVFGALLCSAKIRKLLASNVMALSCIALTIAAGIILVTAIKGPYTWNSLGWPARMPLAYQWIWGYTLLNVSSAVIIATLLEGGTFWLSFTRLRSLQYLGKISYGVYVYHQVVNVAVLTLRERLPNFIGRDAIGFVLVVIITSLIAHLSYKYWEQLFVKARPAVAEKSSVSGGNVFKQPIALESTPASESIN